MKIIEVVADSGHLDTVKGIAEQQGIDIVWWGQGKENELRSIRLLVAPEKQQKVLDDLQRVLGTSGKAKIIIIPIEAVLPRVEDDSAKKEEEKTSITTAREILYNNIEKGTRLDSNYIMLVVLSTIVAAIGLIEDNVAVIVGAMVIAPLLGPNIALALATALGDNKLLWESVKSNLTGLGVTLVITILIALLWPVDIDSRELMTRTNVGLDGAALALASGAAAVLSLTTGLASVLVGVMVAVALLPPAATMGLMLGSGQWGLAGGAGLLLAVNIVCVNLAARIVFLMKGVKPRTWLELQKARQSTGLYILIWIVSLAVLLIIIYLRRQVLLDR